MNKNEMMELISGLEEGLELCEKQVADDPSKKLELYDHRGVLDIYSTLLELEQWKDDLEEDQQFKMATRLVKIKRYLPKDILFIKNPKTHVLCGLFMEVQVCIMRRDGFRTQGTGRNYTLIPPMHPEEYGLPSHSEVDYGTCREILGNRIIALSKVGEGLEWLKDYVNRASQWDYIEVSN